MAEGAEAGAARRVRGGCGGAAAGKAAVDVVDAERARILGQRRGDEKKSIQQGRNRELYQPIQLHARYRVDGHVHGSRWYPMPGQGTLAPAADPERFKYLIKENPITGPITILITLKTDAFNHETTFSFVNAMPKDISTRNIVA